jgi:DNA double-strand break repair helicase HerA and related ATPase
VVHTRLLGPASSMEPAPDVDAAAKASPLWTRYGERVDAESAREILAGRMAGPQPVPAGAPAEPDLRSPMEHVPLPRKPAEPRRAPADTGAGGIGDFLRSREGKALQRKVTRGIFGMLRKRL